MDDFSLAAYDYLLPETLIAQEPAAQRDTSRLLLLDRSTGATIDGMFTDFPSLCQPGDILICNNTKVFPARLVGRKQTGGQVEIFLLAYPDSSGSWQQQSGEQQAVAGALLKSSKKMKAGARFVIAEDLHGVVESPADNGKALIRLFFRGRLEDVLERHGAVPLPPYIKRPEGATGADRNRYQTVYASRTGAVAAPTAGFHFTEEILSTLAAKGVRRAEVTLHVGYGTFAPVRSEDIRQHPIHAEYVTVTPESARLINTTITSGGRLWCVGTTTARALEFCADDNGQAHPLEAWCAVFIYPGYRFKLVHNLLTNFHLPKSSLLFLVSAMAGRERILAAYRLAISLGYRFYSYGDAMLITDTAALGRAVARNT